MKYYWLFSGDVFLNYSITSVHRVVVTYLRILHCYSNLQDIDWYCNVECYFWWWIIYNAKYYPIEISKSCFWYFVCYLYWFLRSFTPCANFASLNIIQIFIFITHPYTEIHGGTSLGRQANCHFRSTPDPCLDLGARIPLWPIHDNGLLATAIAPSLTHQQGTNLN